MGDLLLLPALLATPIDHVLIRPDRWSVLGTRTYRVGASDHRAVVARLARRNDLGGTT